MGEASETGLIAKIGRRVDATRDWLDRSVRWQFLESWSGLILALSAYIALALASVLFLEGTAPSEKLRLASHDWIVFTGVSYFGIIVSQSAWAWRVATSYDSSDSARDIRLKAKPPSERLALNVAQLATISLIVLFAALPQASPVSRFGLSDDAQSAVLALAALGSLIPILFGSVLSAPKELRPAGFNVDEVRPVVRLDSISPGTFWASMSALAFIVAVAGLASTGAGKVLTRDYAGLGVLAGILTFCAIVILYPHFVNHMNRVAEWTRGSAQSSSVPFIEPLLNLPPKGASIVDSVMVRYLTPAIGATTRGWIPPHVFIVLTLILLGTLGAVLKPPSGLIPLVLAMILTLSVGRRWTWINDDCETATRLEDTQSKSIHIGFKNDLRDEALLGYSALFLLVPLTLFQLNGWVGGFKASETATVNEQVGWLMFFGAELAKAVPIVDWWEIYKLEINTGYEASTALGQHLTFAARAMVDLVIMAAVLQAISVSVRRRTQRNLFEQGEVSVLDPFQERQFFQHGITIYDNAETWDRRREQIAYARKKEFGETPPNYDFFGTDVPLFHKFSVSQGSTIFLELKERGFLDVLSRHCGNLSDKDGVKTPYSAARLAKLQSDPSLDVQIGAKLLIQVSSVLVGTSVQRLEQLHQRWLADPVKYFAFSPPEQDSSGRCVRKLKQNPSEAERASYKPIWRDQKEEVEDVLMGLIRDWKNLDRTEALAPRTTGDFSVPAALRDMAALMRSRLEFKFSIQLILEYLEMMETQQAADVLKEFRDPRQVREYPLRIVDGNACVAVLKTQLVKTDYGTLLTNAVKRLKARGNEVVRARLANESIEDEPEDEGEN